MQTHFLLENQISTNFFQVGTRKCFSETNGLLSAIFLFFSLQPVGFVLTHLSGYSLTVN